ncbi:MAG: PDZ domain-containing protein [Syntrophomonas sp.]|nr:PDZ domain-containing protein [Syntrophomonas sp.]
MEWFLSILIEIGRVLVDNLTSPYFMLLYLLLCGLVAWQYRRMQNMSDYLLQGQKNIYVRSALISVAAGFLGGIPGSILLVLLGIDLAGIGISYLWIAAIALMLIQPRFMCFAYGAGILSISNLLFGFPDIEIPMLMGLVAVLHLIESLLILVNGTYNPLPVYIMKQGQLRGGFNMQLFWPIPLVALMGIGYINPESGISMPEWWPLLRDSAQLAEEQTYALLPVMAVLGYGEISTTKTPCQTTRKSSLHLVLFSLVLLLLVVLSTRWRLFLVLAAIFSPLGHELVIWLGMRAENQAPIYVMPQRGVRILEVLPATRAHQAGLRSGDVVLSLNGQAIDQMSVLQSQASCGLQKMVMEIERDEKILKILLPVNSRLNLGIIPVPDKNSSRYLFIKDDSLFSLFRRIWRRIKSVHLPFFK